MTAAPVTTPVTASQAATPASPGQLARPGFLAAGLLLLSAALQIAASLERWVSASAVVGAGLVEDHRYDYAYPADPWINVGVAAQLFGAGYLVLAGALVVLLLAGGRAWTLVVAVPFALVGAHALLSGLIGAPSFLAVVVVSPVFLVVETLALLGFVMLFARRSAPWVIAGGLLVGNTLVGYLVATFVIAPMVNGTQSYDTTPWTETIVGCWPALAAVAVLVGAVRAARTAG